MNIIYVLISVSVVVAIVFFVAFVYSVRHGQYDDTYTPSVRMLFEDELIKSKDHKKTPNNHNSIQTTKP